MAGGARPRHQLHAPGGGRRRAPAPLAGAPAPARALLAPRHEIRTARRPLALTLLVNELPIVAGNPSGVICVVRS